MDPKGKRRVTGIDDGLPSAKTDVQPVRDAVAPVEVPGVESGRGGFVVAEEVARGLELLKERLLTMGGYAESAVSRAVRALVRRDDDLARRTRAEDDLIDNLELEIDELAFRLLASRPDPLELRFVAMSTKIANDLERVGDESTTISRRVLALSHEPALQQAAEVPGLASLALAMLKDALDAFVYRDPARAREVVPRDQEVDDLNRKLHGELTELMTERSAAVQRGLNLMVICKSLERIGDHAANIAEQVVYLYEGCDIRHPEHLNQSGHNRKEHEAKNPGR